MKPVLLVRNDVRLVFGLAAVPAAIALLVLFTQVRETGGDAPAATAGEQVHRILIGLKSTCLTNDTFSAAGWLRCSCWLD